MPQPADPKRIIRRVLNAHDGDAFAAAKYCDTIAQGATRNEWADPNDALAYRTAAEQLRREAIAAITPPLSDLEARVLEYLAKHQCADENQLLRLLFPPPEYPKSGAAAAIATWGAANEQYRAKLFGSATIPYKESYAHQRAQACISLGKRGLITSHNNGLNEYFYELVKRPAPEYAIEEAAPAAAQSVTASV